LCRGTDHMLQAALFRITRARQTGLHQHDIPPRVHETFGHEPVAPSDIKNRSVPARRKLLHQFNDARIAMLEPKRLVLDLEALLVPGSRVRNRLLLRSIPDAIVI